MAASACASPAQPAPGIAASGEGRAFVVQVIDGDTIDVTIAEHRERVRLIGVDTPETVSVSSPKQCFGAEASAALASLLPPGTEVRLERDQEVRDRYGRLLAYVHRADDGLFVNAWLLEAGLADVLFYEPNTAYEHAFTAARNGARGQGHGLWSACSGPDQPLGSFPPEAGVAPSEVPGSR